MIWMQKKDFISYFPAIKRRIVFFAASLIIIYKFFFSILHSPPPYLFKFWSDQKGFVNGEAWIPFAQEF